MSTPGWPMPPPGGPVAERLLGSWRLLRAEPDVALESGALLDFRAGGQLLYTLVVEGSTHTFTLVWRVVDDTLETESLADGHSMSARIGIGAGDVLELDFAGARAWFLRELG